MPEHPPLPPEEGWGEGIEQKSYHPSSRPSPLGIRNALTDIWVCESYNIRSKKNEALHWYIPLN